METSSFLQHFGVPIPNCDPKYISYFPLTHFIFRQAWWQGCDFLHTSAFSSEPIHTSRTEQPLLLKNAINFPPSSY